MIWYEVVIFTQQDFLDEISSFLHKSGSNGVLVEDHKRIDLNNKTGETYYGDQSDEENNQVILKGYFNSHHEVIENLKKTFGSKIDRLFYKKINNDWKQQWKESFKKIQITKNILVKPSWDTKSYNSEVQIKIDPGMAFGTGTHETTKLTAYMLEKYIKSKQSVLDLGCGSGILSIIASKLGGNPIVAIDIDKDSIKASKENFEMNDVGHVKLLKGNLKDVYQQQTDIIVANILSHILKDLLDDIIHLMGDESIFISSGIPDEKVKEMKVLYQSKNLKIIDEKKDGRWWVIVTKK